MLDFCPPESTTSKPNEDGGSTTTREPLNGLHGLVDSILDILPQDQLLATFFDKTESDKQFAAFVDSIGNPKFAKILIGLQVSLESQHPFPHVVIVFQFGDTLCLPQVPSSLSRCTPMRMYVGNCLKNSI